MFLDPLINRASESLANYPEVQEYLESRAITLEDIKKFRLGYTAAPFIPLSKDDDFAILKEETKDFFYLKKKLYIPLENSAGLVNGLITRSLEPDTKYRYHQYLMKEASTIGAFFGLPQALPHILREGVVFVVEGAIDCISLAKVFPNTVSTLTSFINEEQMWMLRMIADTIVMVFDPDPPGRSGVEKVLAKYGAKGLFSREFGHGDPNKCLVSLGEEKFAQLAKKSLSGIRNFKKC
jgi:DNA primase